MAKFKVLVTDYVFENFEQEEAILAPLDAELVVHQAKDAAELKDDVVDADAILNTYPFARGRGRSRLRGPSLSTTRPQELVALSGKSGMIVAIVPCSAAPAERKHPCTCATGLTGPGSRLAALWATTSATSQSSG